jgi:lysophospholipase L1-like esterase
MKRLIVGLTVAVAMLGIAELGIRTFAPNTAPRLVSPLEFQRHSEPMSSPGPTPGSVIFGGPSIVAVKEPVGIRVFFFGGSATEAYHMTPYSGFVGWYQRLLRQLMPDVPVEVINLGAGGEASRQVAELVTATATQQKANLFVVYSGNNEYYELRALKESLPGFDARAELARRRLSGLHLYRYLRRMVLPAASSVSANQAVGPIDSIGAEINADERELGVLLYAEHLRNMVEAAAGAKVPMLLSTVADHTRSFAFHGDPPTLSATVKSGLDALDQAGRSRDTAGVKAALRTLRPELETQAEHHAVARMLFRDQMWDDAKVHFERAEYLDPRPRRSSRPMRDALKEVASLTGTPMCDAAARLSAQSPGGVAGDDVFFDPCHPNPLGHRRLAEILLACTMEEGLLDGLSGDVERLSAVMAMNPLVGGDPLRLDHFTSRRAQLQENRGMTEAEVETTIRAHDDGTPQGAAIAGHQAVLFGLYRGALAWYDLAMTRGGDPTALSVSRALTLQHLHDIQNARGALDSALRGAPGDTEIRQFRAVLGDG